MIYDPPTSLLFRGRHPVLVALLVYLSCRDTSCSRLLLGEEMTIEQMKAEARALSEHIGELNRQKQRLLQQIADAQAAIRALIWKTLTTGETK